MKTLIAVLALIAHNAYAYDIDPATGFIQGKTPEAITRIMPPVTDQVRTSGDVAYPPGYGDSKSYGSYSAGNRSYVTSAGSFMTSRAGSTTFVIQTSRGRR